MPWQPDDPRQPDAPESGFYAMRLVKKGPEVGALIEHMGQYWLAKINDEWAGEMTEDPQLHDGVQRIWLSGRRIDAQEYEYLLARYHFYKKHEPNHPFANPDKPINRRLMKPIGG
jgi:hypothetical protein